MENKKGSQLPAVGRRPIVVARGNSTAKPPAGPMHGNKGQSGAQPTKFAIKRNTSIQKPQDDPKPAYKRNSSVQVDHAGGPTLDEIKKIVAELETETLGKKNQLDGLLDRGRNMVITKKSYDGEQENLLKEFKKMEQTAKELTKKSEVTLAEINGLFAKEKELDKKWKDLRRTFFTRKKQGRVRCFEYPCSKYRSRNGQLCEWIPIPLRTVGSSIAHPST
jgi:hypothetical protein